jgi:hypothetical protein
VLDADDDENLDEARENELEAAERRSLIRLRPPRRSPS